MSNDYGLDADDELDLLRQAHGLGDSRATDGGLLNDIRIADEIAAVAPERARILDWGAGQGQMAWLLARRGLDVAAYDVVLAEADAPEPLFPELDIQYGPDPIALPYPDQSFDAALSDGVLEHVPYPAASLAEIARVLQPGGYLFIYKLPQRWSWSERTRETLRLGGTHGRRFSMKDMHNLFKATGFRIKTARRSNLLPQHLPAAPDRVLSGYQRLAEGNIALDRRLSAVPGVNRVAGLLEIIAMRE